jgi:Protein of unknown function (DUF2905)
MVAGEADDAGHSGARASAPFFSFRPPHRVPISPARNGAMARILVITGLMLVALGLLWPWLRRLGLGHLPGDIDIRGAHGSFYFPIVTCVIASLALSLILWLINR